MSIRAWLARRGAKAILAAAAIALILSAGFLFAQGKDALKGLSPRLVAVADGPSGLKWIGGNREDPLMRPGLDCISCHAKGEGPRLSVAGTVYTNIDEKDEYFGVEGAVVQIVDAKGKSQKLTSNMAGNFFLNARSGTPTAPLTVKVLVGKAVRAMESPAPSGNCASCHTAAGSGGAPGRIMAP
jgi:hypothetical protein